MQGESLEEQDSFSRSPKEVLNFLGNLQVIPKLSIKM